MKYRSMYRTQYSNIYSRILQINEQCGQQDIRRYSNSYRITQKHRQVSSYLQQAKMKFKDWSTLIPYSNFITKPIQGEQNSHKPTKEAKLHQSSKDKISNPKIMADEVGIYAIQIPRMISQLFARVKPKDDPRIPVKSKPVEIPVRKANSKGETKLAIPWKRSQQPWLTRDVCASRTCYLLRSVASAVSPTAQISRMEDFCRHLIDNPLAKSLAVKQRAISTMLRLRLSSDDDVRERVDEALALLGYVRPLPGRGIRILSIDGGGTRGVMALEILRKFEEITEKPVHDLFDFVCGVSTGAILTVLLGPLKLSMDECEELYKKTSCEIFNRNYWMGTGKLVLNHAYYDTDALAAILKKNMGETPLYRTARDPSCPKLAVVSTIINETRLRAFVFRNYDYPYRSQSMFPGSYSHQLWEAVRASAAAPGYFEECKLGEFVHQDGGILTNNPSALAIHECRHLWPDEEIQCVISLGNGRHEPQLPIASNITGSSLKMKILKFVDSATDTEGVHTILNDLLPAKRYYRFNPYLSEAFSLDEVRPEKFKTLQNDAAMYVRKNEHKIREAAVQLLEPKSQIRKVKDNLKVKFLTYL